MMRLTVIALTSVLSLFAEGANLRTDAGLDIMAVGSASPSLSPSSRPTYRPTDVPSARPSRSPTASPSASPTAEPSSATPTSSPSYIPEGERSLGYLEISYRRTDNTTDINHVNKLNDKWQFSYVFPIGHCIQDNAGGRSGGSYMYQDFQFEFHPFNANKMSYGSSNCTGHILSKLKTDFPPKGWSNCRVLHCDFKFGPSLPGLITSPNGIARSING